MENHAKHPIKRLTAEFADPTVERAYRVETFPAARRHNRIVAVIVAILVVGHAWSDYTATGGSALFYAFLAIRLATASLILLIFPFTTSARHYSTSDWTVFLAQISLAAAAIYIPAAQTPAIIHERLSVISMTAILLVLGMYLFVQTRVVFHVIAGVGTSIAYISVGLAVNRLAPEPAVMEAIMHVVCNVLGFVAVTQMNRVRRMRFDTLRAYRDANGQLLAQRMALKQARDEAVYANRAKSEFLAHMSHELRSPLNAIIGFSEVMTEQMFGPLEPARYREYAGDIHSSGSHLLALINDLLDLSKAEAGRMELSEETVRVQDVADSVLRLVMERARDADLTVAAAIPDDLPALCADPRLVKQMALNLVTNAIKFTEPGGAIRLTADRGRDGGLRLHVADTGVGIDAVDIPRILEPYGQVQNANAVRSAEGTGLGLALVKKMIEMHGGRLEIESTPGEGSTFTLAFPPERTVADGGTTADETTPSAASLG